MKAKSIESSAKLLAEEQAMFFSVRDITNGSTRNFRVDLAGLLSNPEPLLAALFFATKTRLRNATAGQEFSTACEAVEEMATAISEGRWESRVREPGEARTSPLIRALAAVLFGGDTAKAQEHYDLDLANLAKSKGVICDPEDDDEAGKLALRKLKADYKRDLMKVPALKKELLRLEAEAQMAAAKRKLEAANAVQVPE